MMSEYHNQADKNIPKKIEFNYPARGFYCPTCDAGVSLNVEECPYCQQKLCNPYEVFKNDKS